MSYILDALKKSEQQRNEGDSDNVRPIHGLYSPSEATSNEPARRWPWILLSAVVFSVGIGSGSWFYFQATQQTTPQSTTLVKPEATTPQIEADLPKPAAQPSDLTTITPVPAVKPAPTEATMANADTASLPAEPAVDTTADNETVGPIVPIADLPDNIRQNLPAISFAGHVYSSTPEARSVVINGRKLREGQNVSKDLTVDEITRFGAVFRSKRYRFSLSALQDWRNE